jgi:hypothetical protein
MSAGLLGPERLYIIRLLPRGITRLATGRERAASQERKREREKEKASRVEEEEEEQK